MCGKEAICGVQTREWGTGSAGKWPLQGGNGVSPVVYTSCCFQLFCVEHTPFRRGETKPQAPALTWLGAWTSKYCQWRWRGILPGEYCRHRVSIQETWLLAFMLTDYKFPSPALVLLPKNHLLVAFHIVRNIFFLCSLFLVIF